jgi:hypothetical protein
MIPILREHLSRIYNTEHFVEEFPCGLGIADLVFTTQEVDDRRTLVDFESMFYITNYFNTKNKKVILSELYSNNNLKKDKFANVVRYLKETNCIIDYNDGQILIQQNYQPCLQDLYSVEAKLSDWKKGFYQALRYKNYSHKSFLAISYEYAHRVDNDLLKTNNVGLISVFPDKIEIVINPHKREPDNTTAFYYSSESFVARMRKNQVVSHFV